MKRTAWVAAILVWSGFVSLAVAAQPAHGAAVLVEDYAFQPADVTVTAGSSVTWTLGADPEQHTVTPRGHDAWRDSGQLFAGDTFEVTFDRAGRYEYLCTLHPTMTGTVTVEAATATELPSPTPRVPAPAATPATASSPTESTSAPSGAAPTPPAPAATGPDVAPLAVVLAIAAVLLLGARGLVALRRRR